MAKNNKSAPNHDEFVEMMRERIETMNQNALDVCETMGIDPQHADVILMIVYGGRQLPSSEQLEEQNS